MNKEVQPRTEVERLLEIRAYLATTYSQFKSKEIRESIEHLDVRIKDLIFGT